ncbi:hypothetical protein RN001_005584 [Aquatica leii]|uniref:Uncharacterized protein n=1 Tax=Aquatica leii TaxID=1421715 RepID=A0AAN7P6R5_9COLE|nr:hypothetical protein RN001_005584 [Aquatica leii]
MPKVIRMIYRKARAEVDNLITTSNFTNPSTSTVINKHNTNSETVPSNNNFIKDINKLGFTNEIEFFQGSGNYESYEVAVEKCEAAKYESDLNSDIDNIALKRKRTCFPPKRYLISSSDEERSESDLQRSRSPLKKKRITVISNKMITPPLSPTPSSLLFLEKDRSSSSTNTADCIVLDDVPHVTPIQW